MANTSFNLPDKARISGLTVYYTDHACLPDRRTLADNTVGLAVVDNAKYSYVLAVLFSDGVDRVRFHGATIYYE